MSLRSPRSSDIAFGVACSLALTAYDLMHRVGFSREPLEPANTHPEPTLLAQGAPYHTFPAISAGFYTFHLHPANLPLIAFVAWGVHRLLAGVAARGALGSALRGMLTALVVLACADRLFVEATQKPWKYVAHPTRIWMPRSNMVATRIQQPGSNPQPTSNPAASPASAIPYTDGRGFRPTPQAPPGSPSLLIVGDSSSFGTGIWDTEQTYAYKMGQILAKLPQPYAVYNRAVPGYTSWQGLKMLREQVAALHPRIVLAGFMPNDWSWREVTDASLDAGPVVDALRAWLRVRPLYLWLEHLTFDEALSSPRERTSPPNHDGVRVPVPQYEANLREMVAICKQHQARLVLLCLPLNVHCLGERSRPYREAMARVAQSTGTEMLDFYSFWADHEWDGIFLLESDPIHPRDAGHTILARQICMALGMPVPEDGVRVLPLPDPGALQGGGGFQQGGGGFPQGGGGFQQGGGGFPQGAR